MSYQLELEQGLSQKLNQFQMQSLNILSLDNYELEKFLQDEFAENPMLDYHASGKDFFVMKGNAGGYQDVGQQEIEDYTQRNSKEFFMEQMNPEDYSSFQWKIMEYMVECVDESGLLTVPLEDICEKFKISMKECEDARTVLKGLEPAGVFAVNLRECLLLQLQRDGSLNDDLYCIVENYLEDIALGRLAQISRNLKISTAQVHKYISRIQLLNPRPYSKYAQEQTQYILPDILIESTENGDMNISLNDNWMGNYSLNDYYVQMMEQVEDSQLKEYFRKKYERCRFIIMSIEQRRETMLKISRAVYEQQREFFTAGLPLKPMTMQNIADDIQMHVSTVSRAVKGKYIQYPCGTVSFRDLFSSAQTFGNQDKTSVQIKDEIKKIIQNENVKKPYSDAIIVKKLEEKGITISRRTVAKYRMQMGIAGVHERKERN